MAVFTCDQCGETVDTRCKPKKCPACSKTGHVQSGGSAAKKTRKVTDTHVFPPP